MAEPPALQPDGYREKNCSLEPIEPPPPGELSRCLSAPPKVAVTTTMLSGECEGEDADDDMDPSEQPPADDSEAPSELPAAQPPMTSFNPWDNDHHYDIYAEQNLIHPRSQKQMGEEKNEYWDWSEVPMVPVLVPFKMLPMLPMEQPEPQPPQPSQASQPAVQLPPRLDSTTDGPGSERQRIAWSVEKKKLNDKGKGPVSPPFDHSWDGEQLPFKLMLQPSGNKGGFKNSGGKGQVAVKCEKDLAEGFRLRPLKLRISIGEEPAADPVTHDFCKNPTCQLPKEWDFKLAVKEGLSTFLVCLEMQPQDK